MDQNSQNLNDLQNYAEFPCPNVHKNASVLHKKTLNRMQHLKEGLNVSDSGAQMRRGMGHFAVKYEIVGAILYGCPGTVLRISRHDIAHLSEP